MQASLPNSDMLAISDLLGCLTKQGATKARQLSVEGRKKSKKKEKKIQEREKKEGIQEEEGNKLLELAAEIKVKEKQSRTINLRKAEKAAINSRANYDSMVSEMDKWIGVVKSNRERDSVNFSLDEGVGKERGGPLLKRQGNSALEIKMGDALGKLGLQSTEMAMKSEQEYLSKLDPEEAKERLKEARRKRLLLYEQERKNRRIAKIKSKLYRKIKKRQKLRSEAQRVSRLSGGQRTEYIEKLTKDRISERISLRHSRKGKYIENLLRFSKSRKLDIQNSINQLNELRHQKLKRSEREAENSDDSGSLQDAQAQEAAKQLAAQITEIEEQYQAKPGSIESMKFMRRAEEKKRRTEKNQISKIIANLSGNSNEGLQEEPQDKPQERNFVLKFDTAPDRSNIEAEKPISEQSLSQNLRKYFLSENQADLASSYDVKKLREKYAPHLSGEVGEEMQQLDAERLFQIAEDEAAKANAVDFEKEKYAQFEMEAEAEGIGKKRKKGWGNWTGPGITEPKTDPKVELARKIQKIKQVQARRKDGNLLRVTIDETRNRTHYLVPHLPYEFSTTQQFNYLQAGQIGPEWNSFLQFKDNIHPKIIKKAGQPIEPIAMPKTLAKE